MKQFPTTLLVEIASGNLEVKTLEKRRAVRIVNQHIFPQTCRRGFPEIVASCRSRWVILRQNPRLNDLINEGVPAGEIAERLGRFLSIRGVESPS